METVQRHGVCDHPSFQRLLNDTNAVDRLNRLFPNVGNMNLRLCERIQKLVKLLSCSTGNDVTRFLGAGVSGIVFEVFSRKFGQFYAVKLAVFTEGDSDPENEWTNARFFQLYDLAPQHLYQCSYSYMRSVDRERLKMVGIFMEKISGTVFGKLKDCLKNTPHKFTIDFVNPIADAVIALTTKTLVDLKRSHGDMHLDNIAHIDQAKETRYVMIDFGSSSLNFADINASIYQTIRSSTWLLYVILGMDSYVGKPQFGVWRHFATKVTNNLVTMRNGLLQDPTYSKSIIHKLGEHYWNEYRRLADEGIQYLLSVMATTQTRTAMGWRRVVDQPMQIDGVKAETHFSKLYDYYHKIRRSLDPSGHKIRKIDDDLKQKTSRGIYQVITATARQMRMRHPPSIRWLYFHNAPKTPATLRSMDEIGEYFVAKAAQPRNNTPKPNIKPFTTAELYHGAITKAVLTNHQHNVVCMKLGETPPNFFFGWEKLDVKERDVAKALVQLFGSADGPPEPKTIQPNVLSFSKCATNRKHVVPILVKFDVKVNSPWLATMPTAMLYDIKENRIHAFIPHFSDTTALARMLRFFRRQFLAITRLSQVEIVCYTGNSNIAFANGRKQAQSVWLERGLRILGFYTQHSNVWAELIPSVMPSATWCYLTLVDSKSFSPEKVAADLLGDSPASNARVKDTLETDSRLIMISGVQRS